ncbi:MAG: 2-dehydropantoate 2-reductase [Candidatus Omnitrophica bacterium]|nr:2-dehydropantoate 2-reductase [Candidatus Omnitrophota bacterium]
MKVVVIGPGAIGCLLAAFLSKSKEEIWLLDKNKERAQIIGRQGIRVEGVAGNWQADIRITADVNDIGKADLVIVTVKSYDTKEAVIKAKALIDENTSVLTLQNGIGNVEIISEIISVEKVIGGVTNLGVTLTDTGRVRFAGRGETVIGRLDSRITVEMRKIREIFNKSGLQTRISRDIKGLLWSKLLINAGINALASLLRLNNGRLIEFEGTRKLMREAVTEGIRVAKRKRIKLVFDDPLAKVEAVCEATAANVCSMLQDVRKNKRTEIEFINGVIVRQGQELGISTPVNSVLLNLIKTIEASYSLSVK